MNLRVLYPDKSEKHSLVGKRLRLYVMNLSESCNWMVKKLADAKWELYISTNSE